MLSFFRNPYRAPPPKPKPIPVVNISTCTNGYTLADHPEWLREVLAGYRLTDFLDAFDHLTKDLRRGIYHGKAHAYATALNCYEGGVHSACTRTSVRVQLVAGLYHDALHSCGAYSDQVNIPIACKALTTINEAMGLDKRLTVVELAQALQAIRATQYPYAAKKLTSPLDKIVRDADLMVTYLADRVQRKALLMGLLTEKNQSDYGPDAYTSIDAFCEQQTVFATAVEWGTAWARNKALLLNWPLRTRGLVADLRAVRADQ